jgi:hypothetical protein
MNLYDIVQSIREKVKGYKTLVANALIGVPGALFYLYEEFTASGIDITQYVPAKYVGLTMFGVAMVGVIMRLFTTGPLGSKAGLPEQPVDNVKEPL